MRSAAPLLRCAAAAGLVAACAHARAEGLSLTLEPTYALTTVETRDQLGHVTSQDSRSLAQNYRLTFDRALGPALSFSTGALLEDRVTWASDQGRRTTTDATERSLYARLLLGLPALTGGLTYDVGDSRSTASLTLVRQDVSGYVNWRPLDLPDVSLRLSRTHDYDLAQASQDLTTVGALLSAHYLVSPFEARYHLLWSQPSDAITRTESSSIDQVAQASYSDRLFGGLTTAYASVTLRNQVVQTLTAGAGTVTVQQHPIAGLSLIEATPVLPGAETLALNPALVDGNLVAGAAIDLGYALPVAGDSNRRHLGVQFGDVVTPVNRIQVWVDRRLPVEVSAAFAWTAFQSDDNKTWSPVAISGPVTFAPFQNQFEIPILETRARYLKVVTRPLQPGVTTDPAFASVLVTEVQVLSVTAASAVPREQATSGALVTATASTLVSRRLNLRWDLSGTAERRASPDVTVWSLLNGLTGAQELARGLLLSERLTRQDGDFGVGRVGQTDWSGGLAWTPLPTFTGSLVYTGQYVDARPVLEISSGRFVVLPGGSTNTLATLARADLYEGLSTQLNASTGLVKGLDGKSTVNSNFNATASITPNPWVSLALVWLSSTSTVTAPGTPDVTTSTARADASLNLRPTNAISASGTVSRTMTGASPTTSGSAQVNYSPLRGDLLLSFSYSNTFDTASNSKLELFTPTLRWNVRPGVQLNASYTFLRTSAPVSRTDIRTLGVGLNIIL